MNSGEVNNKTIVEVFNELIYGEKLGDCNLQDSIDFNCKMDNLNELNQVLKITKESKSFDVAVDFAVKAHNKWKNSSALKRANSLHKIWKDLRETSKSLSKLKNEFSAIIDYFDFYSDLIIQTEEYKNWRPHGVVLVVLSEYCPLFILGATVSAALATGCSIVVLTPEKGKILSLFLEEIISQVGLPEGLLNVVTEYDEYNLPVSKKISKVFFSGSYLSAQTYYTKSLAKSFNFICSRNTTALILESCDLDAAISKIITETWGKNSFFAVKNIVVQESIKNIFLEKLKDQAEQFLNENINDPKFRDKVTSEKIKKIILDASKAGALIEKSTKFVNDIEWTPTIIVDYQSQNLEDDDIPILKVSVCRTGKEGAALANNGHIGLGTSVWTEISSQALEISTMLTSPNIWINCHGVLEAGEPLQPSGISGDCTIGGSDGILEYMSFRLDDPAEGPKSTEDKSPNIDKVKTIQMVISAQQAFSIWQNVKNRRKYLKDISHSLEDNKELSKLSEMISNCAHFGNIINFSERNSSHEFSVVKRKIPIGVILLIVNTSNIDVKSLTSLIMPAIVLGNAVIVVLKEENSCMKSLIKTCGNFLPKSLLSLTVGIKAGIHLVSDPNIQAIWLYEESVVSAEFLQTIKNESAKSLKHIWVIPKNVSVSQHLFQKECLRNKVVWLTKVDQFP